MVIITPQTEIDLYFENESMNQSLLKSLLSGMDNFLTRQQEDVSSTALTIGAAVDCILTGETGIFDAKYHVSTLQNMPSATEMTIVNSIFLKVASLYDEIQSLNHYVGTIEEMIEANGWQPKWKMETKVEKIIVVGSEYFEDLKLSVGKQVISVAEKQQIDAIVDSLKTHPRTAKYFDRPQLNRLTEVVIIYQLPIYFQYQSVDCKALLDFVILTKDATGKVLTVQGFDLKTMGGNTLQFLTNVRTFRYDIQAAWYTLALGQWCAEHHPDAVIKPYMFIVESSNKPGQPLLFECSSDLLAMGKQGRPRTELTYFVGDTQYTYQVYQEIKGIDQLMDDFLYYEACNWVEDRRVTENNGHFIIDWNELKG